MTPTWVTLSGSQVGSVHVRNGTVAQDAHVTWADDTAAVIAVADGHGHSAHFRSATGAALAVGLAKDLLVDATTDFRDAEKVEQDLRYRLGPALTERWRDAVLKDVEQHPFTENEQTLVDQQTTVGLTRPYGSTIVAMAVSGGVLAALQIGDGEAVVVLADGTARQPLPADPDLHGAVTTSLCQPDPLRSLRCAGLDLATNDLVLGFVCTDGFGAGRVDGTGWWRQVGQELLGHARDNGFDWIGTMLPQWLQEPAQIGGDDTTLALLGSTRMARQ